MEAREPPSWRYLTVWYATSVCLLLLLPVWRFGLPVWRLPRSHWLPFACLATAFVVSAGIAALLRPADRWRALWLMAVSTIASFGVVFLGFIVTMTEYSRAITIATFLFAVVLVPAPYVVGASRVYRAIAFGALLAAAVVIPLAPSIPRVSLQTSALIKTEYYNLDVKTYSGAFPKSAVRGGALARIGDRYLRLSGDGHLYVFGWDAGTDRPKVRPLPYRVPINGDEFAAAAGRPWADLPGGWGPQEGQGIEPGGQVLHSEWFRTYGLLVQETGSDVRVFVSHDLLAGHPAVLGRAGIDAGVRSRRNSSRRGGP